MTVAHLPYIDFLFLLFQMFFLMKYVMHIKKHRRKHMNASLPVTLPKASDISYRTCTWVQVKNWLVSTSALSLHFLPDHR